MSPERRENLRLTMLMAFAATTATCLGLICVGQAQALDFSSAKNFNVGADPVSVAIGDFNVDGTPDIATANSSSNNVSVLLGTGDATFGPATNVSVGQNPYSVLASDFNGDELPDLAVANQASDNVSILLGTGTGAFEAGNSFPTGSGPYSIAVGDFDDDSNQDLVTANYDSNDVSILLGEGDGSFVESETVAVPGGPVSVVVGDLDGDDVEDIATANTGTDNVSVLAGTGDGSFGAASDFPVGSRPLSISAGDVDSDGDLDLATANDGSDDVSVLIADSPGTFGNATNFQVGRFARSVSIGDVSGDGRSDLVVAADYGDLNRITVFFGVGNGSFDRNEHYPVAQGPWSLGIGDLNGDENLDVATANLISDSVSVLTATDSVSAYSNPGTLSFGSPVPVPQGTVSAPLTFSVINSGEAPIRISRFEITGVDANDFFVSGTTCTDPILETASCEVDVRFAPQKEGNGTAKVTAISNATTNPTVELQGSAGPPLTSPTMVSGPSINGAPVLGETLVANPGEWTGNPEPAITYQWQICDLVCADVLGATGVAFEPTRLDLGKRVRVRVNAKNLMGELYAYSTETESVKDVSPPRGSPKLKLFVLGPNLIRRGKTSKFMVAISNASRFSAKNVKLRVSGRGIKFQAVVGTIRAESTKAVNVKLKPRAAGKVKARFRVTSSNAPAKAVRETLNVKK